MICKVLSSEMYLLVHVYLSHCGPEDGGPLTNRSLINFCSPPPPLQKNSG